MGFFLSAMNAITIENLVKVYANGTQALQGINLEVSDGDFFALLGANGAGKTTIIGILTGLVNKTSGKAKVFDFDLDKDFAAVRKVVGVVPQEFNFNMFEKVQDIIVQQGGYFGIDRPEALKRTERILKQLGIWDKRNVVSRSLSGGMKRRLMIARALINEPKLLILDEPTAGVDVELRYSMWEFLRELNEKGTTILLTTHYLEEVEQMCRNAAMIKNGEIISHDRVSRLVQLIDDESYVVTVEKMYSLEKLKVYKPQKIDEHRFEVDLGLKENLNEFIALLSDLNMIVMDLRPKGNRMEKLFLKFLKQS